MEYAKRGLNGEKPPEGLFDCHIIGESQALLILNEKVREAHLSLLNFYACKVSKKPSERDFERALIASNIPFPIEKSQQMLRLKSPQKNYTLEVFSGNCVFAEKEAYRAENQRNAKDFQEINGLVKKRHPGEREKAAKKNPSIVRITLDLLYNLTNNGSDDKYLLGEVKAYPYTERSKIERRAGQIKTYFPCLKHLAGCRDLALIYPTLPSKREMNCYLQEPVPEPYSLHILTITEKSYLQNDLNQRISSAKRNIGRHPGKGWEEELNYLEIISGIME